MTDLEFPAAPPAPPARRLSAVFVVMILVALAGLGLAGYGVVTVFGYRTVLIPGRSMGDTVPPGSRLVYRVDATGEIHRGDLVVFEGVAMGPSLPGRLLKRVVAVGGDIVTCCDAQGRIQVNGKSVAEPYVQAEQPSLQQRPFSAKVPPDTLFVMGDVRDNSDDSRFHPENGHNGAIPRSKVDGVVVGRGSVLSFDPLTPTTAFTDAGLPGGVSGDSGYGAGRLAVVAGLGLTVLGIVGVIVSAVRSNRRKRLT